MSKHTPGPTDDIFEVLLIGAACIILLAVMLTMIFGLIILHATGTYWIQ